MKEYDIFLRGTQAQDYMILVGHDVVSGNIIISSIPFHEVISGETGLIIDTERLSTFIKSMIEPESNIHIHVGCDKDADLRMFNEAVFPTSVSVDVVTEKRSVVSDVDSGISIDTLKFMPHLISALRSNVQKVIIKSSPVDAVAKSSMGDASTGMVLDMSLLDCFETVLEAFSNGCAVSIEASDVQKRVFERTDLGAILNVHDVNLLRKYHVGAPTEVIMSANIEDTDIHFSLGDALTAFTLDATSSSAASKFIDILLNTMIAYDCTVSTISVIYSVNPSVKIETECQSIVKRHRLLSEVDDIPLADIDNTTLDDLDYVVLE